MPFDVESVRRRLPGREVVYRETADSTMREAAHLAAAGCLPGTAVVADEQTAGQGRHGHQWHSQKEAGLYVSIVLRPTLPDESWPVLTLALGLAAAEAIARATDLACDLRWPNDVMIDEKKAGGILLQVSNGAAVAGIGINVNHTDFPAELAGQATSLRVASGRVQSREDLCVHLLIAVDSFCRMLVEAGKDAILEMFARASSYVRGKQVVVTGPDGVHEGVTEGLDSAGFLIVRRRDGTKALILAGGVRAVSPGRG